MYTLVPYRRYLKNQTNRMASLFDDPFFRTFFHQDGLNANGFKVDIHEMPEAYRLEAELPGVPQEEINLSVDQDMLTISADINVEKSEEKGNCYYSERRVGHVERSFNLEGIDQEGIKASCKDGILTVLLPKSKPAPERTARRIEIVSEE